MKPSATSGSTEPFRWPRFGPLCRAVRRLIFVLFPPIFRLLYRWRVIGQEHLRQLPAAISLCNHVHTLDCVMMACALHQKELLFLSLPQNLHKPVAGWFVRLLGGVGVPQGAAEYRSFYRHLAPEFEAGRFLQIYPEGWLEPWCPKLREFHPGAFQMAVRFGVPVLPCVLRQRPHAWGRRGLELHILPPLYADPALGKHHAALDLQARAQAAMENALRPSQAGTAEAHP